MPGEKATGRGNGDGGVVDAGFGNGEKQKLPIMLLNYKHNGRKQTTFIIIFKGRDWKCHYLIEVQYWAEQQAHQ